LLPVDAWRGLCPGCLAGVAANSWLNPSEPRPEFERLHRIGDYELLEEVGRGAMGVVWRARQESLNRVVAVKVLLTGSLSSEEANERFRREALAAAALKHPNIVTIYEIGVQDGWPFFSMELVVGSNLSARLREAPPSSRQAAQWLRELADAVQHAHSRKVVHRDIKPANILIDERGAPHLTDFGLAKPLGVEFDLTLTGTALGSANYMAPEQAAGRKDQIGPAVDVYALGAVLYHLLTGRPPFLADSLGTTLRQVQEAEPIAPRRLNPAAPRDLETICLKCLEKSAARRYASAQALADDLRKFLEDEPIRARPVSSAERAWRKCRRRPLTTATLILMTLGAITFTAAQWFANRRVVRALHEAETHRAAAVSYAAQSRAGLTRQFVARGWAAADLNDPLGALPWFVAAWRNDARLATDAGALLLPAVPPHQLQAHAFRFASVLAGAPRLRGLWSHGDVVSVLAVSADGNYLATGSADGAIYRWDLPGARPLGSALRMAGAPSQLRFSPDGRRLVSASGEDRESAEIGMWNVASGRLLFRALASDHVRDLAFDSTGNYLAYASRAGFARVLDAASGAPRSPELRHHQEARRVCFTPDNRLLITASWDRTAAVWDWRTGTVLATLQHEDLVRDLAISPDGRLLATAGDDCAVHLWRLPRGDPVGSALRHSGRVMSVAFSPDASSLAAGDDHGQARVWETGSGRLKFPPLKHTSGLRQVSFSPDGRRLLTTDHDNPISIWDAETGELAAPQLQGGALANVVCWHPSGEGVFVASRDFLARWWELPANGPSPRTFQTVARVLTLAVSADERLLLAGCEDGSAWLRRLATPNDSPIRLIHRDDIKAVGFDAEAARCFTLSDDGAARVWETVTGNPLTPPLAHPGPSRSAGLSPDGRWLLTGGGDGVVRVWDTATSALVATPVNDSNSICRVAFSPSGRTFATARSPRHANATRLSGCAVRLWETATRQPLTEWLPQTGEIFDLKFSPDGARLVSAGGDGLARAWDLGAGKELWAPLPHPDAVRTAVFSPDGKRVLTGCQDGLARLWDAATGRLLSSLLSHVGDVEAQFSPDGRWILTIGNDYGARLWDAVTCERVCPPLSHAGRLRAACFSPRGAFIATGGDDAIIRLWPLTMPSLTLEQAATAAVLLSGRGVDATGGLVPATAQQVRTAWEKFSAQNSRLSR